jgi:hypothetical protein
LRELMVGLLPKSMRPENFGKKDFEKWEWRDGRYEGTIKSKDKTITAVVDGELAVLRKLKSESKTETIEITFSEMTPVKQTPHAKRILVAEVVQIKQMSSATKIEVDWGEVVPLSKVPSTEVFKIELPENVRKIRF